MLICCLQVPPTVRALRVGHGHGHKRSLTTSYACLATTQRVLPPVQPVVEPGCIESAADTGGERERETSTSARDRVAGSAEWSGRSLLGLCIAAGGYLSWTTPALASEAALSEGALEVFKHFLVQLNSLGPWGPALFVATVMCAEMVPLLPTQPLSIASGLLFGPLQGSICMLLGVTLAAFNAYSISRGVGRTLAQRVISEEMGDKEEDGGKPNAVQQKILAVQQVIESGGFWQQLTAVALLRLTPIVPFSASNYILGLTPISLPAYLGGTMLGMSVWSLLYASLGGASRALLEGGMDLDALLADLSEKAGMYTQNGLQIGAVVGAGFALVALASGRLGSGDEDEEDEGGTLANSRSPPPPKHLQRLPSGNGSKEKVKASK